MWFDEHLYLPGNVGTTGGGTGGRDLDNIEKEVNDEDEECCLTATRADIIVTHLEILNLLVILSTTFIISENKIGSEKTKQWVVEKKNVNIQIPNKYLKRPFDMELVSKVKLRQF